MCVCVRARALIVCSVHFFFEHPQHAQLHNAQDATLSILGTDQRGGGEADRQLGTWSMHEKKIEQRVSLTW